MNRENHRCFNSGILLIPDTLNLSAIFYLFEEISGRNRLSRHKGSRLSARKDVSGSRRGKTDKIKTGPTGEILQALSVTSPVRSHRSRSRGAKLPESSRNRPPAGDSPETRSAYAAAPRPYCSRYGQNISCRHCR